MLIQNQDAAQIIRDQAKLTLSEGFPQNLLPNVQPVMDMTPRFHRTITTYASGVSTSGAQTVYTAVTGKRLYIVGVFLGVVKDATNDMATGAVTVTANVGGSSKTLAAIPVLTLTAQDQNSYVSFERPIVVDRGANVSTSATFTAGAMRRNVTIYGYELEE